MWNWFADTFFPFVKNLLGEYYEFLWKLLEIFQKIWRNKWTLLVSSLTLLMWALNHLADAINNLTLEEVDGPAVTMLQYYMFMNRFVPLSEAFAGAVIAFHIWAAMMVFRIVGFIARIVMLVK